MEAFQQIFDLVSAAPRESVWAYPATPRLERCDRELRVVHSGVLVAHTTRGLRLISTGHPPVYWFPLDDVVMDHLAIARGSTWCAFLGPSRYFDVVVGNRRSPLAAWTHFKPSGPYSALSRHVAFYAGRVDGAFVDGEPAIPQPGGVYGGWITADLIGPYKGGSDEVW